MTKLEIPGAPKFLEYLESIIDGEITIKGPEIIDRSYNGEYGKEWKLSLDSQDLGVYRTFGPKPGENEFEREYLGRIPGYRNDALALGNKSIPYDKDKKPEDKVSLIFSNRKYVQVDEALLPHLPTGDITEEELRKIEKENQYMTGNFMAIIVKTDWKRQDGHTSIQFP
ncbi:hypothetical protein J4216_06415 [Candidatus Woesearchaeota archaeon]|nr:hypothetical protein [Candidatus Woesearchaeota archaeon]